MSTRYDPETSAVVEKVKSKLNYRSSKKQNGVGSSSAPGSENGSENGNGAQDLGAREEQKEEEEEEEKPSMSLPMCIVLLIVVTVVSTFYCHTDQIIILIPPHFLARRCYSGVAR